MHPAPHQAWEPAPQLPLLQPLTVPWLVSGRLQVCEASGIWVYVSRAPARAAGRRPALSSAFPTLPLPGPSTLRATAQHSCQRLLTATGFRCIPRAGAGASLASPGWTRLSRNSQLSSARGKHQQIRPGQPREAPADSWVAAYRDHQPTGSPGSS